MIKSKRMCIIQNQPSVFAVIPIRNRKDKTLRFLEGFVQQKYWNLNIVVVDANSTDGTQDAIITNYPQVKLIHANDECYWTASTNLGIKYALAKDADFVLTINDDSYVDTHYVTDLVDLALKYNIKILGSRIDYMDNPGLIWALGAHSTWGTKEILQLSYNKSWIDDLPTAIKEKEIIEAYALAGNGVLINKTVFEKIGIYNEVMLPHYHADSEFIMRAVKNGIQPFSSVNTVVYNDCADFRKPKYSLTEALIYPIKFTKRFFTKSNNLYFLPVFYITFVYCPIIKIMPTLLAFFLIPLFIPLNDVIKVSLRAKQRMKKIIKMLRL